MKITKSQLKQIINEELSKVTEAYGGALPPSALGGDEDEDEGEGFSERVGARLNHANNFLGTFQYVLPVTPEEEEALNAVYIDMIEQLEYELEP